MSKHAYCLHPTDTTCLVCGHQLYDPQMLKKTQKVMRPCLNEYCLKTKVIALDWQWVTLGSWCQMNRNGHCSPVKHKVEGKPHQILGKNGDNVWKIHLFGKKICEVFLGQLCSHLYISLNTNDITPILHTCLTSCWSGLCSTALYLVILLFLGRASEKEENKSVKLVSREGQHFWKSDF